MQIKLSDMFLINVINIQYMMILHVIILVVAL